MFSPQAWRSQAKAYWNSILCHRAFPKQGEKTQTKTHCSFGKWSVNIANVNFRWLTRQLKGYPLVHKMAHDFNRCVEFPAASSNPMRLGYIDSSRVCCTRKNIPYRSRSSVIIQIPLNMVEPLHVRPRILSAEEILVRVRKPELVHVHDEEREHNQTSSRQCAQEIDPVD